MLNSLTPFLIQWAVTALSLWVASYLFKGLRFEGTGSLVVAALVLGFANALVKPLLIVLTFPLTLLTLGLFLFVINALTFQMASGLLDGFHVTGFWQALLGSVLYSLFGLVIDTALQRMMGRPPKG